MFSIMEKMLLIKNKKMRKGHRWESRVKHIGLWGQRTERNKNSLLTSPAHKLSLHETLTQN